MSTTKANYYLARVEEEQRERTANAIMSGVETIPPVYYNRVETMEVANLFRAHSLEHVSVILTRSKIKALSSDKKWRPVMEELRADLRELAPVYMTEDGEGRRRFNMPSLVSPLKMETVDTTNNKVVDLINSGIEALEEWSIERTFLDSSVKIPFVRESSKYYDNGNIKPSNKWIYDYRTPIEEARMQISRFIEGQRTEAREKLQVEVEGTGGRKYRRSNLLEIHSGNNDASKVVERFSALLAKEEKRVFNCLYVNDMTREETADKLKTTVKAVSKAVERIKGKVIKAGLVNGEASSYKEDNSGKTIDVFTRAGECIGRFESVRLASEKLGVGRSHIQDVLSGRRKTAGGYVFAYAFQSPIVKPEEETEKKKTAVIFGHTVYNIKQREELIRAESERYSRIKTNNNIPSVTDGEASTSEVLKVEYFNREDAKKLAILWEKRREEVKQWEEERKRVKPVSNGEASIPVIIPAYTGQRDNGLKAVNTHDRKAFDALVKEAYRRKREEELKAYREKYGE